MLGLWQPRYKIGLLFFLITLLFVEFCFAYEISVTPSKIEFDLNSGGKECVDLDVQFDSGDLAVESRWSKVESHVLKDYIYGDDEMEIQVDFSERATNNGEKINACFKILDNLQYNGLILIYPSEKAVGVGVWVKINSGRDKQPIGLGDTEEFSDSGITGRIILENQVENVEGIGLGGIIVLSLFGGLFIVFLVLVVFGLRGRRKREVY